MLFLPLLGAECRAGKEGNFAPTGQRGRENCDLAEQRSARTRLSLCKIFSAEFSLHFFIEKMQRNPIQSLSLPYGSRLPLHKGAMVGGLYRGEAIFSSFWRCFPKCVRAVRESPRRGFVFLRAAARGKGVRRAARRAVLLLRLPGGEQGFEEIKQTETFHSEKNPSFS